jgi:predicted SnoaL-like aldol condensation-catalyzing enzyme
MNAENDEVIHRWFQEVWNDRRAEAIDELSHPACVGHHEGLPPLGLHDFRAFRAKMLALVPDFHIELTATVSDGDDVVARWRITGCSTAGNKIDCTGMSWLKIVDGKIVEAWDAFNPASLTPAP